MAERFEVNGYRFEIEDGVLYAIYTAERRRGKKVEFYEQRRLMLDANGRIEPAENVCREYAEQITKGPLCKAS